MRKLFAGLILLCLCLPFSGCVQPKEDSGAYDKAVAALETEDYDLALEEFQNAAETDGRLAEAYRGEGIVHAARGDYKHAVMLFDMSLENMEFENDAFKEDVLFYKAESLVNNSLEDEALALYRELQESSRASDAYALEGRIYMRSGNEEEAQKCFSKALEKGKSIDVCLIIYETCREMNREGDGAAYLKEALDIVPSTPEEYAKKGKIYDYLEDYNNAVSCLNRAIDGGYNDAVAILGNIYLKEQDISGAKALYTNALKSGTDIAMAYNGLAMCAIAEENYDSALTYVALGLDCEDSEAEKSLLFNEIIAYEYKLDFETAKQKCAEYIERYPADEQARREYKFLTHGD